MSIAAKLGVYAIDVFKERQSTLKASIANNEILKSLIERVLYGKSERNTRGNLENCNFSLFIFPSRL